MVKTVQKVLPQLRFPEFDGEWSKKILKEFTKINQGLQIPISERFTEQVEGSYFYITNEFLREGSKKSYFIKNPTDSVICDEDDILMTRTGNTGQVVTGVHGAFHNNFFKIKFDACCDKWYLYYFLTSYRTQHKILTLAGTSTIPDLNHGDFYKLNIALPKFPEQQKIASFLSAVDQKIQQLTKKKELLEQYKKGVMQQLFSGQLRFKKDDGTSYPDWEEFKVQELINKKAIIGLLDGNHGELYPKSEEFTTEGVPYIAANSLINGLVDFNQCKRLPKQRADMFKKGIAKSGDVLFAHNATVGPTAILKTDLEYAILSTTVTYYRCDTELLSNSYLLHYFNSDNFVRQYTRVMSQSTRNQVPITMQKKFKVIFPSLQEQQKIARYLSAIDTKTENVTNQITQTQTFKKGLLQQLFV